MAPGAVTQNFDALDAGAGGPGGVSDQGYVALGLADRIGRHAPAIDQHRVSPMPAPRRSTEAISPRGELLVCWPLAH